MNLEAFLQSFDKTDLIKKNGIVYFNSSDYPLLFFSLLKQKLAQKTAGRCRSIDLQTIDFEQLKAELSISFLADNLIYWCGNINVLDAKNKKNFLTFAHQYHGPHTLWFFSEEVDKTFKKKPNTEIIDLPNEVSPTVWQQLYDSFFPLERKNIFIFDTLCKQINRLSLETACLLLHYASLISRPLLKDFIRDWLDIILVPEKSLFTLSTCFFSKKGDAFFALWHDLQHEYPPQFWISFWSEQLFRATCFVKLARANKFLEAKKIAYRLPFTLIKKDWKTLTSKELAQAHHFLYDIDYRLKNGGDSFSLDLFYTKFLQL